MPLPTRAFRARLSRSLGRSLAVAAVGPLLVAGCSSRPPTTPAAGGAPVALATMPVAPTQSSRSAPSPSATPSTSWSSRPIVPVTASTSTTPPPRRIAVPTVSDAQRRALPVADTYGHIRGARTDRRAAPTGRLAHIARDTVAFRTPGGDPVAVIPDQEVGVDTWLPVIDSQRGWLEVRLPSRPNGVVAWVSAHGIRTKITSYRVSVSLHTGTMTMRRGKHLVGRWRVAYGRPSLPTPATRTFVMTRFHDPNQSFSPVIFALGAHSDAMASFEGGPGTIAIHGWPTYAGRHGPASHGCVRVPGDALDALRKVPNGTPVDITG